MNLSQQLMKQKDVVGTSTFTYPKKQITTQAISDGKTIDSITFKPE
ncbi:hypothetical protein DSOL_2007 [Desulfosporosinus metallidurans]|uniref:Uncharacterized protein n=1 Tax=Desulfosporosinus metallidurans TaxID=1888891 RepID=A0A1Q8QXR0_9FIRM|nr:hypothetical protein DSOL_2007 [Desulfosporosinus metallidurans]